MSRTQVLPRLRPHGCRAGFTLVELLVVIGIIALLISILLPALSKAREAAAGVKCASNIRQLGVGFLLYANDTKGNLPYEGADDGDKASKSIGPWNNEALWINAIPTRVGGKAYYTLQEKHLAGGERLPIDSDNNVFVCPLTSQATAPGDVTPDGYFTLYGGDYNTVTGISTGSVVGRPIFICYAYNSKIFDAAYPRTRITKLKNSTNTVLLVEKRMRGGEVTAKDDTYFQSQGGPANRLTTRTLNRLKGDLQRFTSRHNRGGYILFADGHVAWFSQKEVLTAAKTGVNDWNHPSSLIWNPFGPADQ